MKQTLPRVSPQSGFTLIEILVVVVIIGILATFVGLNILDAPQKARVEKARAELKQIETALGLFKLDNGFYPSTEQGLAALVNKPTIGQIPKHYKEGGYLKQLPEDPWGNDYIYLSPGIHGPFDLESYGADGEDGGEGDAADIENWYIESDQQ